MNVIVRRPRWSVQIFGIIVTWRACLTFCWAWCTSVLLHPFAHRFSTRCLCTGGSLDHLCRRWCRWCSGLVTNSHVALSSCFEPGRSCFTTASRQGWLSTGRVLALTVQHVPVHLPWNLCGCFMVAWFYLVLCSIHALLNRLRSVCSWTLPYMPFVPP